MHKRLIWTFISIVSIIALGIYWSTVYQTITWWDSSSYSIAANCFGVESAPGSLFLTILGWVVLKLTFFEPKVFALNLFAGLLAVTSLTFLFRSTVLLLNKTTNIKNSIQTYIGISIGVLIFAFSETFWTYAIQFTPYILTTCMTSLILYQLLKFWFEDDTKKIIYQVLLISFLFGLDFSIHRTNALLIPAFIIIIMLKDLKLFLKQKIYLAGFAGLFGGLAFQLIKIVLASFNPIMNSNNPDNFSRFYDYVSLKQKGGGFLTDVFTRKSAIFDVQIMDYLNVFINNFIALDSPVNFIAILTLLVAFAGIYFLFKQDIKTVVMLLILFVVTTVMTIFYFNIPENYFRTFTRHYLPSFVLFSIFISYGSAVIVQQLSKYKKIIALLILFILPCNQIFRNYQTLDGSNDSFASDYGNNILNSLRPNAILFVSGDVYYPIFYMQQVEGKRTDVDILSLSLCNTQWYIKQLLSEHYNLPLTLNEEEIVEMQIKGWTDTTINILFKGDLDSYKLETVESVESISIKVPPTISDRYIRGQDLFVLALLQQNKWEHPIYFTQVPQWLNDYVRPEGLVFQLVPQFGADINFEILMKNLFETYKYDGYADSNKQLEFSSKGIGETYWNQFIQVAIMQHSSGDTLAVQETIEFMQTHIPLERIARSEKSLEWFENILKQLEQ